MAIRMMPPRLGCPSLVLGVDAGVSSPAFSLPPHAAANPAPASAAVPVRNFRRDTLRLRMVSSSWRIANLPFPCNVYPTLGGSANPLPWRQCV